MSKQYSDRISEISDIRERARRECEDQQRLLGERAVELSPEMLPETAAGLLEEYQQLQREVENSSSVLERMITIDERQAAIRDRMKALQKERDSLADGLEPVYERIGALAFQLFRNNPMVDSRYSTIFADLARYHDDVRKLEHELDRYGAAAGRDKRPFMERLGTGSRTFLLRNRRKVRENQLPGLLQRAGHDLAESGFIEQMDDEELNQAAGPILQMRMRREEIDRELETLRSESGELLKEFNGLSDGKRLAKARREREDEIDRTRTRLVAVLSGMGAAVVGDPPEALAEQAAALQTCRERITHFDSLLARLEAGREAQELSSRVASLDEQIGQLKAERDNLQDRLKEQESLRGDESELFDGTGV